MDDNEYIEGLAEVLETHDWFENYSTSHNKEVAQAITDWHREQGLRVVRKESVEGYPFSWL